MPWNQQTTACGRRSARSQLAAAGGAYHHVGDLPYAEVATALLGGSTDAARRAAHDGIRALRHATATPNQHKSKEARS